MSDTVDELPLSPISSQIARRGTWFIGWPAPLAEIKRQIDDTLVGQRRLMLQDWHLTCVFLGAIGEESALSAWQAACRFDLPRIEIGFDCLQPAGRASRPSAWVLTLTQGRDSCAEWMARLDAACRPAAGLSPASRSPWPHLTVARRRGRSSEADLKQWNASLNLSNQPFSLNALALFGPSPAGSTHRYRKHHIRTLPAV